MAIKNNRIQKFIVGIICILPATYLTINQFYSDDSILQNRVEIITVNKDISPDTIISEKDLILTTVDSISIEGRNNIVLDPKDIIGLESTNYIVQGTMLLKDFFVESELNIVDGEHIISVPMSWILSTPQSVRRGDFVSFYAIADTSTITDIVLPQIPDAVLRSYVYYAKDTSNREVVDTSISERYDGTSNVSNIEIKCTKEDLNKLKVLIEQGYKFILAYD